MCCLEIPKKRLKINDFLLIQKIQGKDFINRLGDNFAQKDLDKCVCSKAFCSFEPQDRKWKDMIEPARNMFVLYPFKNSYQRLQTNASLSYRDFESYAKNLQIRAKYNNLFNFNSLNST